MSILRYIILSVIYFTLNINLYAQIYSIKGQFWASGESIEKHSDFRYKIGYIPTFSAYYELSRGRMVDLEWAYRLDRSYSGNTLIINNEIHHRYWVRFSSEKLEARLGLQKIVFGPSQILRSLSWFDTIDLKDPTGQTEGVEAFRLRWFPSNSLSLWSWAIMNEKDTLSFGGRVEFSTNQGEWGFTYHMDPSNPHQQVALDYRYDGFIGFWNESTLIQSDELEQRMVTIGSDYTLPIANGILIMTESKFISRKENMSLSSQTFTAFMGSLSIGIIHQVMLISNLDWDENNIYNYLHWSSTYERFSINYMASINPNEMGNSFQLMLIYNH